jgi:putative addiction module component (TIGR02574 family)
MSATAKQLFDDALRLPEEDRARLAAWLIESLEPEGDSGVEAAWEAEIIRRMKDLDSGRVKPIRWSEARRNI